MHKRTKLWSSLGLAALVGCGSLASSAQEKAGALALADTLPAGAEGGEGEGIKAVVDPITSDVAYLTQLGLMRGHLLVGLELYRAGHLAPARTHMKHPESELYANLVPALKTRGAAEFADQLSALANLVARDDSSAEEVEAAYSAVLTGITEAEIQALPVTPSERLRVVVNLVRTAAEEYAIGVVDGQVLNAHEYQDALGFTLTARALLQHINPGDNADLATTLAKVNSDIQALFDAGLWPDVMPPDTVEGDASLLYGTAARIEIAALGLR